MPEVDYGLDWDRYLGAMLMILAKSEKKCVGHQIIWGKTKQSIWFDLFIITRHC